MDKKEILRSIVSMLDDQQHSIGTVLDTISQVAARDRGDLNLSILKLVEEVGELSAANLSSQDYKSHTMSEQDVEQSLKEESIDVLIMAMTVISKIDMTNDEVMSLLKEKCVKWVDQLE